MSHPSSASGGSGQRFEVRLAGEGGQGLILAGLILAEAAAIYDNKNAVMTQTYGAQQRGGPSRSEVIISEDEIDYPKVVQADLLLALNQDAFDRYHSQIRKGGLIVIDAPIEHATGDNIYRFPVFELAQKATGRPTAGSIAALGVIAALTGIVSHQALEKAVRARSPGGTEEPNRRALEAGFQAARGKRPLAGDASQYPDFVA